MVRHTLKFLQHLLQDFKSVFGHFTTFQSKELKYSCQKPMKKNCGRPVFLEELQAARNFSKVSLHFNKIPNSLRQVLQTYSEICIFCVPQKKSSRSSQRRLISKCQGNLVVKLMTMWWNSYYSKFGSEIWRQFGILGISFFIQFFNFLQMLWLYSSVNKKSVI